MLKCLSPGRVFTAHITFSSEWRRLDCIDDWRWSRGAVIQVTGTAPRQTCERAQTRAPYCRAQGGVQRTGPGRRRQSEECPDSSYTARPLRGPGENRAELALRATFFSRLHWQDFLAAPSPRPGTGPLREQAWGRPPGLGGLRVDWGDHIFSMKRGSSRRVGGLGVLPPSK